MKKYFLILSLIAIAILGSVSLGLLQSPFTNQQSNTDSTQVIYLNSLSDAEEISVVEYVDEKPDALIEDQETEHYGKLYVKDNGYILNSKTHFAGESCVAVGTGRVTLSASSLKNCTYYFEREDISTGEVVSFKATNIILPFNINVEFDFDTSRANLLNFHDGRTVNPVWSYSTTYNTKERIATSEGEVVILPTKEFTNYQPMSAADIKTTHFSNKNVVLDPGAYCGLSLASNTFYELNQSLQCNSTIFTIGANVSNMTFDGNGFTITGNYTSANYGFSIGSAGINRNITIQNFTITLVERVISGTGTDTEKINFTIRNLRIINTTGISIGLGNLTTSTITGNYIEDSGNNGIQLITGSKNNLIVNNTVNKTRAGRGVHLSGTSPEAVSGNDTLANNTIFDTAGEGILIVSTANTNIIGNTIYRAVGEAIDIQTASNNTIITGNFIRDTSSSIGIIAQTFSNNTLIMNNNLTNGSSITAGSTSQFSNITRNQIWGTQGYGIIVNNVSHFVYENNISNTTSGGILLQRSAANTIIRNNRIFQTAAGIQTSEVEVQNITIRDNIILNTSSSAILFSSSSSNNLAIGNNITNAAIGIEFAGGSSGNTAQNNILAGVVPTNIRIQQGSNNSMLINNTIIYGVGSTVTASINTYFTSAGMNSHFNLTHVPGTVLINRTATFYSIKSQAAAVNNVTLLQLRNALIHNNSRISGSASVNSNDGEVNITNFGGTANTWFILNDYNKTEGVTRLNDPISFTATSITSKTLNSTLLQGVNSTVVVLFSSLSSCQDIQTVIYVANGEPATNPTTTCVDTQDTLTFFVGMNPSSNQVTIDYFLTPNQVGLCNAIIGGPAGFFSGIGAIWAVLAIVLIIGVLLILVAVAQGGEMSASSIESVFDTFSPKAIMVSILAIALIAYVFIAVFGLLCSL